MFTLKYFESTKSTFTGGCCGSRSKTTRVGGWAWAWWLVTDVQRLSLEVSLLNKIEFHIIFRCWKVGLLEVSKSAWDTAHIWNVTFFTLLLERLMYFRNVISNKSQNLQLIVLNHTNRTDLFWTGITDLYSQVSVWKIPVLNLNPVRSVRIKTIPLLLIVE